MRYRLFSVLLFFTVKLFANVGFTPAQMQHLYEQVKTPYKYGMAVAPKDNYHKIDCPTVFRNDGKWYMTYVVYNGKDGLDGRGYETWLAESADLLHWKTLGRLLSYKNSGWDMNQRGGFPSLIDWTWNGSYEMKKYHGRYWMTYIGGHGTGYEAVKEPLNIGVAWTKDNLSIAHEWNSADKPLMSIHDKDAQWWEKLVQYKSTVYEDKSRILGKRFVMFYNAGGINPANNLKAERIGIALSNDMKKWQRYAGNPVYYNESPGIITGDAQIVKMDSLYVMFYFSAYNPTRKYNAFNTFAVSRNLVDWQDWTGEDLIYPSKSYDDMFAHKSYVVKHDGVVYHFYCAVNKAGQRGIAVATSVPMGRSDVKFPETENNSHRKIVSLDKSWRVKFTHTNADSITSLIPETKVSLPNNLDDYYGYRQLKHGNLHGSAVYHRSINVEKREGKRYFLELQGVGTYATLIVNGYRYPKELVGRTVFTEDITQHLHNGDNELSIEVDHPEYIKDSPWVCGGCSSEWGFSEGSQPFGIYRPVSLVETDEVRIEPFGIHVWNNANCDSVFIDTEIKNYGNKNVDIELVSKMNMASGKTYFRLSENTVLAPGETKVIHQYAKISNPERWSLESPYLYNLASMIKRDGNTVDEVSTPYGIRSISWPVHRNTNANKGQFLLNGKPVFINGTCDYEHLFGQSHAFSNEQIASRVKMMRQAGFNAFREAHQPHNLYYQELMDSEGMLFWSQFSAHIWYDTEAFRSNFKKMLQRYIKERRNSPSIILWGLQNESVLPKDFAEECSAIIREMDPTCRDQRAITTCNGGEGTDWNVIQNWSGTYGGSADNYSNELKQPLQLLNGEYGAWRTLGLHGDERYSEESFTRLLAKKATLAESVKDSVCGHFQWIFVSHENPGRVQPDESVRRIDKVGPFNYKGLLSPWEQPTEAFYWYRNHYATAAVDTITPTAADRNVDILKPADGYSYLYRVNCGGDAYVDSYGNAWSQDNSKCSESWSSQFGLNPFMASQGHVTTRIHGTDDADLFRYFRWGRHKLKYHFKVDDDSVYRIELYFAEPWLGARYGSAIDCEGERIFDVAVNDSVVANDVDLWAEAGYAGAYKRVVYAKAFNHQLTISFPEVKAGQAVISAIAVARHGDKTKSFDYSSALPSNYWHSLDNDTIAKYPKSLLPKDTETFPAVKYNSVGKGEWIITPGVAREYALRFRYRNITDKAVVARLTIVDNKGIVVHSGVITFPTTQAKVKILSSTTGTQINAGKYRVIISNAKNVDFETLEIQ